VQRYLHSCRCVCMTTTVKAACALSMFLLQLLAVSHGLPYYCTITYSCTHPVYNYTVLPCYTLLLHPAAAFSWHTPPQPAHLLCLPLQLRPLIQAGCQHHQQQLKLSGARRCGWLQLWRRS
jgi:hypothetical protein